jgi:MoaA/NifB/PqqE/SkfB family radical SAM enzyme
MMLPERLNYAIARRCPVQCPGCYEVFGRHEPDRRALVKSATAFVSLGMNSLTLSGGDPLLLAEPLAWIADMRAAGMCHIKVDTVGAGLLGSVWQGMLITKQLLAAVDALAIPIDGWDDTSARMFRRGVTDLHSKTVALLSVLDRAASPGQLIVNTVVHAGNIDHLERIARIVLGLSNMSCWNLFQYTPTDQSRSEVNDMFVVQDATFDTEVKQLRERFGADARIQPRSITSRLGDYLLVNSDGEAWIPDRHGRTIRLGMIHEREREVLAQWASIAGRLRDLRASS